MVSTGLSADPQGQVTLSSVAADAVSPSRDFSSTGERVLDGSAARQRRDGGVHW